MPFTSDAQRGLCFARRSRALAKHELPDWDCHAYAHEVPANTCTAGQRLKSNSGATLICVRRNGRRAFLTPKEILGLRSVSGRRSVEPKSKG